MNDKEVDNNSNLLEDETAFFGLTNSPKAQQRRDAKTAKNNKIAYYQSVVEAINRNGGVYTTRGSNPPIEKEKSPSIATYKKVTGKSIGPSKETKVANKVPVRNLPPKVIDISKITQKVCIIISAIAIVTSLGASAYVSFGDDIREAHETRQIIKENTSVLESKALLNLLVNGLAEINPETNEITVKNNTVKDYYRLNIDNGNKYDIYAYSQVLSSQEFDKFIQTVTYAEGIAYTGKQQFLTYNGYKDPKDNIYKIEVFQNLTESEIATLPSDVIERYKSEDSILTFRDLLAIIEAEKTNKTVGGK